MDFCIKKKDFVSVNFLKVNIIMGKYLEKVKKIHIEALKVSQQEGNETFRGLNVQLIFISAAILSFSLLIFLNKDYYRPS